MTLPFDENMMADATTEALAMSAGTGPGPTPSQANDEMAPNPPEDTGESGMEMVQGLQKALFGDSFPPAQEGFAELVNAEDDASQATLDGMWASWTRELWQSRDQAARRHLYLVARNRLFRGGYQWVQSRGGGPWANPARPKDALRLVHNLIDKALDQRLQILTDQRPGFTVTPMTQDPEDRRKAAARQMACEYQFEQMNMEQKARESGYWAQTDGVAFWHMYWDDTRGPWDDTMLGGKQLGDLNLNVLRVEQVRVSPEATATVQPSWVVIREVLSAKEAAHLYGVTGVQATDTDSGNNQMTGGQVADVADWVLSQTVVGEGDRLKNEQTVERFTVYAAPNEDALPGGLHLVVVGDRVVFGPSDLLWNVIPVVRVADGSSDPSYFPRPVMEQWIDHQTRMNVLLSKWQENIRVNAGGRLMGRPNTIATETFLGGVTSIVEVRGGGALSDSVMPLQGFSVGTDVKEAFALEKQAFEDASGYNTVSRGQVSGESGRAIIASREQLERVFAPAVQAMAQAYTDWAKVALAIMAWGYDVPRTLGMVGKGRPDLARELTGKDVDGSLDVRVEKGTLMPMPISYRMYLLDTWLGNGTIDAKEYRRRQPFANAKDMSTPDEDQEARAKRVADAIRLGVPAPPIRWQDNESIHQDVLEREILLQDDLPEQIIAVASDRWTQLANQASMKMGPMPGAPMGVPDGGPSAGGGTGSAPSLSPNQTPLAQANPSIAAAPLVDSDLAGLPAAEQVAITEDRLTPQ